MRRLLIVGAGRAGLGCVEQLLKLAHEFRITVFEGPVTRGRANGFELDTAQREWLRKNGVEVRAAVCVEAIDRHANVVRGCDGSRTTFDTLILAAGAANPELGRAAGLEVRSGVVVNDYMETSDAHVYALAEGAEHRRCIYSDDHNVENQARVLAAHVAGLCPNPFRPATRPESPVAALDTGLDPISSNTALLDANMLNQPAGLTTYAALPGASADSAQRSEDQTPALASLPALAGAV